MKIDNRYELAVAHYHRLKVRLKMGDFIDADNLHARFLEIIGDHPGRAEIDERYMSRRREAVPPRKRPHSDGCN